MVLDSVEDVHAVLAVHHVHCQAPLAKAASAPDPVQVSLIVWVPILVHRKVKVDDNRHLFNVDTCMKERWGRVRMGDRPRTQLWGEGVRVGQLRDSGTRSTEQNPEENHRAWQVLKKLRSQ